MAASRATKQKLNESEDARNVASLPRQPLLAEPGSIQLPRFVFKWLVGPEAHEGAFSLPDLGLLTALLGAFANRDATLVVGGRFEEAEDGELTLVAPGGDFRLYGRIAGSPIEDGSGYIRVRAALAVLVLNNWFEIEETVAEMRIRLGERARKLDESTSR